MLKEDTSSEIKTHPWYELSETNFGDGPFKIGQQNSSEVVVHVFFKCIKSVSVIELTIKFVVFVICFHTRVPDLPFFKCEFTYSIACSWFPSSFSKQIDGWKLFASKANCIRNSSCYPSTFDDFFAFVDDILVVKF